MPIRPFMLVVLSSIIVAVFFAAIIIVPPEVMFYLKEGKWYHFASPETSNNQINDFQLYRKSFHIQKKTGVVRILAIGGSTTYGFGLSGDQAWPSRLESKLNKSFPGKFEVINLAYLGGHLEAFISDFKHVGRVYIPRDKWINGLRLKANDMANWGWAELNPDIVIAVPIVNDTAPDYTYFRNNTSQSGLSRFFENSVENFPVLRNLAVTYYLKVVLQKRQVTTGKFNEDETLEKISETYHKNLSTFLSLWGRDKKIILLGLPWLFSKNDADHEVHLAMNMWGITDQKELMDELSYFPKLEQIEINTRAKFQNDHAVTISEVGGSLKAKPYKDRVRFYLDPVHVTAEGHELFADEIYDLVVTENLVIQQKPQP